MNNTLRKRRTQRPMIKASMSAFEIEMLTSAGKKMVDEELEAIRSYARENTPKNN